MDGASPSARDAPLPSRADSARERDFNVGFSTGQCPNPPQGETRDDDDHGPYRTTTRPARQLGRPEAVAAITIEWALGSADDTETVMRATLDTLTPAARETFVLNKVSGQSYAEIARSVGRFPVGCPPQDAGGDPAHRARPAQLRNMATHALPVKGRARPHFA